MSTGKAPMRAVYLLIPLAFMLMAYISAPQDGDKPKTTPYHFTIPKVLMRIPSPPDNLPTEEGVELGRKLFYDPILSGNRKQACAGCHKQELAFSDGMEYSMGSEGKKARRNSLSLVNLGWQNVYFWDGRAATLEDLIHFPVTDTLEMHADIPAIMRNLNKDKQYKMLFRGAFGTDTISMTLVAKAISQFLRTIVSYDAPFDRIYRDYTAHPEDVAAVNKRNHVAYIDDRQLLLNGLAPGNEDSYGHDSVLVRQIKDVAATEKVLTIFSKCLNCHYTTFQPLCGGCEGSLTGNAAIQFKNNGLEVEGADKGLYHQTQKEQDKYLFKVPTLRNVAFTAPYMHDGRFKTLDEVVEHYNSGIVANQNLDTLLMDADKKPIRFNMTASEKKQLISLIKLFTDTTVMTNPRYGPPPTGN